MKRAKITAPSKIIKQTTTNNRNVRILIEK